MAENPPPKAPGALAQEFVVRASGARYHGVDHFLGKFPQTGHVFQNKKSGWELQRQAEPKSAVGRGPPAKQEKPRVTPWELQNGGQVTHVGHPEGGISGEGAGKGYFVLVKEGPHFTAVPVKDWYTFRPNVRSQKVMSLDEAERKMNALGASSLQLSTNSKLGALAAKAEAEGPMLEEGDQEGEEPDTDEERETQRAARTKAADRVAANKSDQPGNEDMPDPKVHMDKGEKGEDWEHEDEHADDDLEQGEEEGSDQEHLPASKQKETRASDSDNDDNNLTEEGKALHKILRKTHLSSGSEDEKHSPANGFEDDLDDDDDDDEDIDLDAMASDLMPQVKIKKESTPSALTGTKAGNKGRSNAKNTGSRQGTPQPNAAASVRNKRKSATPPVREDAKKARPAQVKQEATPANSTQSEATSGAPGAEEIAECLRRQGPLSASELTARFKKRLVSKEDKAAFMASVKKISRLEERPPGSGKKVVVLK